MERMTEEMTRAGASWTEREKTLKAESAEMANKLKAEIAELHARVDAARRGEGEAKAGAERAVAKAAAEVG
jgi:uncharacterized protein YlxW (UPF0749 family)